MSQKAQQRRTRAFERFTVDEKRAAKDKAYAQRKATELAALKSRLNLA